MRLLPALVALLLALGGPAAQGSGGRSTIQWQEWAESAAKFIGEVFVDADGGGFATTPLQASRARRVLRTPTRHLDSNIRVARFANLLFHYTGNGEYRELTTHAMRYLASPAIAEQRRLLAGILLTDQGVYPYF